MLQLNSFKKGSIYLKHLGRLLHRNMTVSLLKYSDYANSEVEHRLKSEKLQPGSTLALLSTVRVLWKQKTILYFNISVHKTLHLHWKDCTDHDHFPIYLSLFNFTFFVQSYIVAGLSCCSNQPRLSSCDCLKKKPGIPKSLLKLAVCLYLFQHGQLRRNISQVTPLLFDIHFFCFLNVRRNICTTFLFSVSEQPEVSFVDPA